MSWNARRNFVTRTVRDGAVRINGETFRPQQHHRPYDGRLDGLRMAFGLYWTGDDWQRDFVELWGSQAMSVARTENAYRLACEQNPALVDGRYFPWSFWDREGRVR